MHIQVSTHCMHPHSAVPRSYQSGTPLMKSPAKMFDVDASDATPLRVPRCVSRLWNEDYQAAKTHQTWGRSNSFVNYVTNQEWGLWPKVAKCWIYIYILIYSIYIYIHMDRYGSVFFVMRRWSGHWRSTIFWDILGPDWLELVAAKAVDAGHL